MILYEFFARFSSGLGFCTLFRPTRRFSFIGLFRLSYLEPVLLIPSGDGFQGINVRLHDGFSQQGAHGGLKGFRQRDQQVRVGDR